MKMKKTKMVNYRLNRVFIGEGEDDEGDDEESEEEDDDYILTIDFKDHFVPDLLDKNFSISPLKEVHLDSLEFVNSQCRSFLKSRITSVEELYINQKSLPAYITKKIDIEYYLMAIKKVLSKAVRNNLLLGYFNIGVDQFNQIVKASHNLEFLSFNCCKLQFNESLDFSLKDTEKYNIRVIALTGCGKDFNGGTVDEEGLKHFIKAISQSGLKDSLKQLSLTW